MRKIRMKGLSGLAVFVAALAGCVTTQTTGPTDGAEAVFYPGPPESPRIQFLMSFNDASAFSVPSEGLRRFVVGEDTDVATMMKPYGVAMHEGTILVCDTFLKCVHAFNAATNDYSRFGESGRGQLRKPINITIAPNGERYVSDTGRGQVVVFGPDNGYLRAIGERGEMTPTACAVVGDEVFVVDIQDHEIERRNAQTGERLGTFGSAGAEEGQLFKPTNIAADESGRLYVSDTINCRIQIFDPTGSMVGSFGKVGDGLGDFTRPKGVAVDPEGLIYVVDAAFANVQVFDATGKLYLFFGGPGPGPGEMHLPAGIALSAEGLEHFQRYVDPDFVPEYLIIVVNQYGFRRVSIYAKGHERGAS